MHLSLTPVSKPRMTRSDKWKQRPCVVAYRKYKDDLKENIGEFKLGNALRLRFHLPMPASWSKKRRREMNGQPHQSTPDIDNLTKGILDALLKQDSHIYHTDAAKFWSDEGAIIIENIE